MAKCSISKKTIIFGVILIISGVAGYFLTGRQSFTALIPAFIGLPVALLGWGGKNSEKGGICCAIAALLMLLGLGGCIPGLLKLIPLLTGADIARPAAVYLQSLTAILAVVYLLLYGFARFAKPQKSQ